MKSRKKHKHVHKLKRINITWTVLLVLFVTEYELAYFVLDNINTSYALLNEFINILEYVAPVLRNVSIETTDQPDAVRCYITITLIFMPIKVWMFYRWLNSNRDGVYRHLVVSPLTNTKPARNDRFILEPLRQENKRSAKNMPRSKFSRFIWSTMILIFTYLGCWTLLTTDIATLNEASSIKSSSYFSYVPLVIWMEWTLFTVSIASVFVAISLCITRDYKVFITNIICKKGLT